jgi:hypothetical protein
VQGQCLCGLTRFELNVSVIKAYQCHCSLCRMQSGTASNLGAIIPMENFIWLSSREHIKRWKKETGFTSDFCAHCGSPVPNELRGMPYYWVPVGAMEDTASVEIVAHLCVASKAEWDSIPNNIVQYDSLPNIPAFIQDLNS